MKNQSALMQLQTIRPYFSYQNDQLCVHYGNEFKKFITMDSIINKMQSRSASAPLVVFFKHILAAQLDALYLSFNKAILKYNYTGTYELAYPVKVNPEYHIVKSLQESAQKKQHYMHYEVGSKSEFLSVLGLADKKQKIICNGFKDHEFYELAQIASKVGFNIVMVLEHYHEIKEVEQLLEDYGCIEFNFGLRVKPFSINSHSQKFGLDVIDVGKIFNIMKSLNLSDKLILIHGHIGSQLKNEQDIIDNIKSMMKLYATFKPQCVNLNYIDFGGGLGVDYYQHNIDIFSMEYYADLLIKNCIIFSDYYNIDHPHVITESGRAITAVSSLLLVKPLYQKQSKYTYDAALQNQWLDNQISYDEFCQHGEIESIAVNKQIWLNFSLFQSIPDQWGVKQYFPIMPINRNGRMENLQLFDISCDADGMISYQDNNTVPIQASKDSLYAFMFVGAYQGIMSLKHNMMGKTTYVEIDIQNDKHFTLNITPAENNHQLLQQYGYNPFRVLSMLKRSYYYHQDKIYEKEQQLLEDLLNKNPYMSNLNDSEEGNYVVAI